MSNPTNKPQKPKTVRPIAQNRRATFEFEITDRFEAGMSLLGTEVKSLRNGKAQITDAYVRVKDGEAYLHAAHIAPYTHGSDNNHLAERVRKLLMQPAEIEKIRRGVQEKGLSVIPIAMYFKGPWAKIEIALARGKKLHDKREDLKAKADRRELRNVR
jgi:SsrA-binding protein